MFVRSAALKSTFLATVVTLFLTGCTAPRQQTAPELPTVEQTMLPETVRVRTGQRIVTVPFEDYVLASALSEVSPVADAPHAVARIFEVQTVMARTYAAFHVGRHAKDGFDLCDQTHCQLYQPERLRSSRFAAAARAAVAVTRGQVVAYGLRPIQALFHADCGGHTAAAEVVWGGRRVPYLGGAPDHVPADTHRRWRFAVGADRLREALNRHDHSAVGRRLEGVTVVDRDASGRAAIVEIRGETKRMLRGEQLRTIVNTTFGSRSILSPRFEVSSAAGTYIFLGTGYGHGVGLCQVGAAARARRGESLEAILTAYYPGAHLTSGRPAS